ncbi:MAG: hypothetical protein COT74_14290 [Bdellovibrionales bacterium CG10_big_fil_rev_8_21_14_0_10_45_34]|nr:MAG: hypothetical protein COT74_14290 [Bdellovibrionales bacterium CG10_big_fil_rev_8_21_14_0_10_45_34]
MIKYILIFILVVPFRAYPNNCKVLEEALTTEQANALESLFIEHESYSRRLSVSLARGNHRIAEEIFDLGWLLVTRGYASFRSESTFRTWLTRIFTNARSDIYRQYENRTVLSVELDSRNFEREVTDQDLPWTKAEGGKNAESTLIKNDEALRIHKAIETLPTKYRVPLTLFHLSGQTHKQIAETLDMNENTVKTRLVRAREMLAERLAKR